MRKTKTDEEIKSALARCGTSEYKSCEKCPYYTNTATCVERMLGDALELFNIQNEEIKRLNGELIKERTRRENAVNAYHEAKAEIGKWKTKCGIFTLEREMYKGGSVEAIKEFAERLKEKIRDVAKIEFQNGYYYLIGEPFIDNIVEEMVGETK